MPNQTSRAEIAYTWWREFGPDGIREDRGAFARLRRSVDEFDRLIEPLAITLVNRLDCRGNTDASCTAAGLAALLAHVRKIDSVPVAKRLKGDKKDTPLMSALRFQRLMQALPGEERFTAFRRAIGMLDGKANIQDLANAYLNFDHPHYGRQLRLNWMLAYADSKLKTINDRQGNHTTIEDNPE